MKDTENKDTPDMRDRTAWAEQAGREAVQQATAAARTTWNALKSLAIDPPGQLAAVYSNLGNDRALRVGVSCIVIFAVAGVFSAYGTGLGAIFSTTRLSLPTGRVAVVLAAFPVGLWGGLTVLRILVRTSAGSAASVFVAGVAVIPLAVALVAANFLGTLNLELVVIVYTLAAVEFILVCYSGLRNVFCVSSAWSLYGTAGVIIGAWYLVSVVFRVLVG